MTNDGHNEGLSEAQRAIMGAFERFLALVMHIPQFHAHSRAPADAERRIDHLPGRSSRGTSKSGGTGHDWTSRAKERVGEGKRRRVRAAWSRR